jgi:hypothetical protein
MDQKPTPNQVLTAHFQDYSTENLIAIERQFKEDYLPDWAAGMAEPGVIRAMLQLCTKDGRRHGNATVVFIDIRVINDNPTTMVHIVTDADNYIVYTVEELLEAYTLGDYILKDFPNPKSQARDF